MAKSRNPAKILARGRFQLDFGKWPDFKAEFYYSSICLWCFLHGTHKMIITLQMHFTQETKKTLKTMGKNKIMK